MFSSADLKELDGNLRDRVDALVETGLTEQEAVEEALRPMGSYFEAEQWRRLNGYELVIKVMTGTRYVDGVEQETERKEA